MVTKYENSPRACVFIGPYTCECITSNNAIARSPFPVKGYFVIFLDKHDSHVSYDSKSNEPKLTCLDMCVSKTIMPYNDFRLSDLDLLVLTFPIVYSKHKNIINIHT